MLGLAAYAASAASAAPSGTYKGSKSILGIKVDATITVIDGVTADIEIGGPITISCPTEKYAYDGVSNIDLPMKDTAGDCIHDAMASAPVSLSTIKYDSGADSVEVDVKALGIGIKVLLTKSGMVQMSSFADHAAWFADFEKIHGRDYSGAEERSERFGIFRDNLARIEARNLDGEMGYHFINKFTDVSPEEFRARYLGYKPRQNTTGRLEMDLPLTVSSPSSSVDWRSHSPAVLTPVKNQGQCGSCWAFSATEQIETDVALATGKLLTLSPQQITSCDKTDLGCNGGNTETAYEYVHKAGGIESEASYPYTSGRAGRTGTCKAVKSEQVATIKGYSTVSSRKSSEGKMVTQITQSPISVCVDAEVWQTYTSGIVGRTCGTQLDHCVQAVGLNTGGSTPYWIVRNSWATDWGINGYIYVQEGINACGIATDATLTTGAALK